MWQYWPFIVLFVYWTWLWWYTRRPSARSKRIVRALNPSGSLLTDYENEIEEYDDIIRDALDFLPHKPETAKAILNEFLWEKHRPGEEYPNGESRNVGPGGTRDQ